MISLVNKSHRYLKFNSAIYTQISKQSTSGAGKSDDEIFKTDAADKTDLKDEKFDDAPLSPQYEEQVEKEISFKNKVENLRNVSRFSKPGLYNKYLKNPIKLNEEALKNIKYLRRIYAQHGEKSGIDPGIAWPHKAELEKILKEEQEYDLTLEQKIKMFIERKNSEIQEYQKLESAADKNLEKQPKQIEQYYQRLQKKYQTLAQQSKKKEELLEKAREYYGFDVDIRDTRVKVFLEKLEAEKKAEEKKRKKENKEIGLKERKSKETSEVVAKEGEKQDSVKNEVKEKKEASKKTKEVSKEQEVATEAPKKVVKETA